MTDKPQTPFLAATRTDGLVVAAGASAVFEAVSHFLGEGRGTIAGASAGSIVGVLWLSRPLLKERWFWITAAILTVLHVLAIAYFDWSAAAQWSGLTLMPLMVADIAIMTVTIYGLYICIYGPPAKAIAEVTDEPRYSERDIL